MNKRIRLKITRRAIAKNKVCYPLVGKEKVIDDCIKMISEQKRQLEIRNREGEAVGEKERECLNRQMDKWYWNAIMRKQRKLPKNASPKEIELYMERMRKRLDPNSGALKRKKKVNKLATKMYLNKIKNIQNIEEIYEMRFICDDDSEKGVKTWRSRGGIEVVFLHHEEGGCSFIRFISKGQTFK